VDDLYAPPQHVTDPGECSWYHTMDLPGLGTMHGSWDLRATIDAYLGNFDFRGKRCLDIGTSSGYLTFEMERRGAAEVVSVDLDPRTYEWEVVPFVDPGYDVAAEIAKMQAHMLGRQRAYWFTHRLLNSKARAYYGTAYRLPEALGTFDVVLIGMMLPHVRDPFRVLEQAAARSSDTIIVTQQAPDISEAYAYFMPDPVTRQPFNAWWSMSEACVERMLGILGFRMVSKTRAEHACPDRGDWESCTAMIASRTVPERT
jgi:SAM-dependent methyltransferase